MSSCRLRQLRASDADEVAALFRLAYGDARPVRPDDVCRWVRGGSADEVRVAEADGRVVGYADISVSEYVEVDVAADACWDLLLGWAEARARELGKPTVRTFFPPGHALEQVVAARGYRYARSSLRMWVELDERPDVELPPGIEVRDYRAEDEDVLRAAVNEAFALDDLWREVTPRAFEVFYTGEPASDPSLWALAWDGDELAGCVLPDPEREGDTTAGWIKILAVRAPWRRRGLGGALLRLGFARLYDRGLRRVGLAVDAENPTGAVRLYERAGMRPVRWNDTWLLEL
jgi:mycothiol synthase